MSLWLRIEGSPVRQIYQDARALPFLDPKLARHEMLTDAGTLRAATGNENANVTLTIPNAARQASALFANPPLGAQATLYEDAVARFTGTITQIYLGADCRVQIQA